ncbi:hypothetical protein D1831_06735 [Lactiplantibacillus garii]|uniref:Uncharacterized protein n=1 Tax=Lactiplantibacillus garii TaxID=2306423 RepID=A0A3R8J7L1_9LACO|nr:hypothetical protein [Lactiplantibacillus garii]RRK10551.1 hypothetical protein D1831_06735 [Lactiplantibacillus garii]
MMMTGVLFLVVLTVGILLSGVFFRYMDAGAGISFSSLKLTDLRMEFLNVLLMVLLLMWALVLFN